MQDRQRFRFPERIVVFLGFLVSVTVVACNRSNNQTSEYSAALMVFGGAQNVEYSKVQGTDQVSYRVNENYPAKTVIDWISAKLEQNNWKPLEHDFLGPNLKLSHVTGWTRFIDARKSVEYEVHQWFANWKHSSGSIVRYQLRYQYPKNSKPDLTKLEVAAVFIPAPLVKQSEEYSR